MFYDIMNQLEIRTTDIYIHTNLNLCGIKPPHLNVIYLLRVNDKPQTSASLKIKSLHKIKYRNVLYNLLNTCVFFVEII